MFSTFSFSKNDAFEKEYSTIRKANRQLDLRFAVLISFVLCVFCLVAFIFEKEITFIVCSAVYLLIGIAYFFFQGKMKTQSYKLFNLIASILIHSCALYCLAIQGFVQNEGMTNFFHGYYLAQGQQIIESHSQSFKYFVLAHIILLISRIALLGAFDLASLTTAAFFIHLAIDFFLVYFKYRQSSIQKSLFREFYNAQQTSSSFKELLTSYLPQNIVIINHNLETLFVNNTFRTTFKLWSDKTDTNLNTNVRKLLDSLKIKKTNYSHNNISGCLNKLIQDRGHAVMKEVVDYISENNTSREGFYSFEGVPAKSGKILFQITIFHLIWDYEEALAVIIDDITSQEEVIALRIADANKDKVIATVSHELRTPLNGILGIAKLAEKKTTDPEVCQYLKLCQNNALLLLSIVNSMLDLQQLRRGVLKIHSASIGLMEICDQVKSLFEFQCIEKNLFINIEIAKEAPPYIQTDESRLKQILINLVGNAFKFTLTGGISLKIEEDEHHPAHIKISVTDTGIGISSEEREKLFKMYGKLEKSESVNKNGVGLGLTISDTIAKLLNGTEQGITLESEVGKGSCFSFFILRNLTSFLYKEDSPGDTNGHLNDEDDSVEEISLDMEHKLAKYETVRKGDLSETITYPHGEITSPYNHPHSQLISLNTEESSLMKPRSLTKVGASTQLLFGLKPSLQKVSTSQCLNSTSVARISSRKSNMGPWVLAVDDNPFNLLVAQGLLEGHGYRVKTAFSGEAAIKMCKEHHKSGEPFKIILMDCQMPIMDGFDTTQALRNLMNQQELPHAHIIALTANSAEKDIERCYQCGMDNHFVKPLKDKEVIDVLSKLK